MSLDRILSTLSAPMPDRRTAVERARLGFLEWLTSLPDGADVARSAEAADADVARSGGTGPAVEIFRDLLREATQAPPTPTRRGGIRGRRAQH